MKTGALLRIPYTYKTGAKDIRICLSGKAPKRACVRRQVFAPPCFYAAVFKLYIEQMRLHGTIKTVKITALVLHRK